MRSCPQILALLALAPLAMAHDGQHAVGLTAGLAHPMTGWDHLLAMVAVGLIGARLGGHARWQVPAVFLAALVAGAGLGLVTGSVFGGAEWLIAASVLVLGGLVALRVPLALGWTLPLVAGFAVIHGLAHGAECPADASSIGYVLGFLTSSAALHALGLVAGVVLTQVNQPARLLAPVRVTGVLVAAVGLGLLSQLAIG